MGAISEDEETKPLLTGVVQPTTSDSIRISDINDIYHYIGVGKFQIIVIFIGCICTFPVAIQEFVIFFLAFNPGWMCKADSSECRLNGTIRSTSIHYTDRCKMNRTEWLYAADHKFSVVTEFDWSCANDVWIYLSPTVFYVGNFFGALVLGTLADKIGRQKVILISVSMLLVASLTTSFAPNAWTFLLVRLIAGFFLSGTYMIITVFSTEIVSERYRATAGMLMWFFYSIGIVFSGMMAYVVREWRKLQLYCSAPFFFVIILIWFCPESFVWLHAQGKKERLHKEVKRIARINGRKSNTKFIFDWPSKEGKRKSASIFSLCCPLKGLLLTLPMLLSWFGLGMVYLGIAMAADDLTGDAYRDFILLLMVDIPGTLIAIFMSDKVGRKTTTISTLVIGGMCVGVLGVIPHSTSRSSGYAIYRLVFGVAGKLITSVTYAVIITWSTELYPTKMRSNATSFFNSGAIIGCMCAPWVAVWLRQLSTSAPFYVMGGILMIAGLSLVWASETKGKKLPQMDDGYKQHYEQIG